MTILAEYFGNCSCCTRTLQFDVDADGGCNEIQNFFKGRYTFSIPSIQLT
jgi:hypothetical protein